jgi:hypothetical protein
MATRRPLSIKPETRELLPVTGKRKPTSSKDKVEKPPKVPKVKPGPGPISPIRVGIKEEGTEYWTNPMQCGELDGNYYVVQLKYIKLPIIEFNNHIRPGIYTWVLLEIDKNPKLRKLLLSSNVKSGYEIGTKHSDIIHNFVNENYIKNKIPVPLVNLLYAGEMVIKEQSTHTGNQKRDIFFNFESGSYMLRLGRQKTDIEASYEKATTDLLKFIDRAQFNVIPPNPDLIKADNDAKESGIEIDKDKRREDNSFITHKKIRLTYETLRKYLDSDAKIYRFGDEKQCKIFAQRENKIPFYKLDGERVKLSSLRSGGKRKGTKRKGTKRKGTKRKGTKRKGTKRKGTKRKQKRV